MVIFNSYVSHYQRVYPIKSHIHPIKPPFSYGFPMVFGGSLLSSKSWMPRRCPVEGWASGSMGRRGAQQFIQEGITVEYSYRYLMIFWWYLYNYVNIDLYLYIFVYMYMYIYIYWWRFGHEVFLSNDWRSMEFNASLLDARFKLAFVSQGVEDCQVSGERPAPSIPQDISRSQDFHQLVIHAAPKTSRGPLVVHVDPKPGPGLFQVDRGQGGRHVFRLSALSVARDWTEFTHRMLATTNLHKKLQKTRKILRSWWMFMVYMV